jgi:hypothetical protein
MKIDMSPGAVTLRLKQVAQLRNACLARASSSISLEIRKKKTANKLVQRTALALGR